MRKLDRLALASKDVALGNIVYYADPEFIKFDDSNNTIAVLDRFCESWPSTPRAEWNGAKLRSLNGSLLGSFLVSSPDLSSPDSMEFAINLAVASDEAAWALGLGGGLDLRGVHLFDHLDPAKPAVGHWLLGPPHSVFLNLDLVLAAPPEGLVFEVVGSKVALKPGGALITSTESAFSVLPARGARWIRFFGKDWRGYRQEGGLWRGGVLR